jgi:hypothetical protein
VRRRELLRVGGLSVAGVAGGAATGAAAQENDFEPLGRLELPGAKELVVGDGVAYAVTTDGFATIDTSDPAEPTVLAERRGLLSEHPDGPLGQVFDGKLGGDRYAIGGPAEPTKGTPQAAVVFDVSDPADPTAVLTHETDFYIHGLDTDGKTLYLCGNDGDRNPLVCVDVETGEELARWSVLDADDRWGAVHHSLRQLHDVWVEDGVAYCSYWNAGTWLVDVSDPADPADIVGFRGLDPGRLAEVTGRAERRELRLTLPGNDHFAMPQRNTDSSLVAINQEAWGTEPDAPAGDLGGVELWDTDAREQLARIEAPPTDDATFGGTWTTAHNFEFVGDRLYTSWYRGGVKVHDVSDPAEPRELAHWRDTRSTNFWAAQGGDGYVLASSWRDPSDGDPTAGARIYAFPDPGRSTSGVGSGPGMLAGAAGVGAAALARRLLEDS